MNDWWMKYTLEMMVNSISDGQELVVVVILFPLVATAFFGWEDIYKESRKRTLLKDNNI